MHLNSLKIQNFRLLEDIEVKRLGHVNLIVGKNNSGKSTVLEALALLASGFDSNMVEQIIDNRNPNRHLSKYDKQHKPLVFLKKLLTTSEQYNIANKRFFIGNMNRYLEVDYIYFIEEENIVNENSDFFSITTRQKVLQKEEAQTYELSQNKKLLNGIQLKTASDKSKIINLDMDFYDLKHELAIQSILPYGYVDTGNINLNALTSSWDNIALTDNEALVIKILQIIDPKIQNLAFLTEKSADVNYDLFEQNQIRAPYVKLRGTEGRTSLHSMGDGIFRLLQIILTVFKARNGFLLIDEFENGLHYSVQPEVWRLIFELSQRYNIQVFATTHSWDCIESFAQVAKEREDLEGVLFRMGRSVRKSDNGKVIATEFNEDELYNLTKDNIEVR